MKKFSSLILELKFAAQVVISAKTRKNDEFWLKMCLFLAKTMKNGEFWLINIGVPLVFGRVFSGGGSAMLHRPPIILSPLKGFPRASPQSRRDGGQ